MKRRVKQSTVGPGNWSSFFKITHNKSELFFDLANNGSHLTLILARWLFPDNMSMWYVRANKMSNLQLYVPVRRLTFACFSWWKMLCGMETTWTLDNVLGLVASAQQLDLTKLWTAFDVGKNDHFQLHIN